jgi:hypothetical protein
VPVARRCLVLLLCLLVGGSAASPALAHSGGEAAAIASVAATGGAIEPGAVNRTSLALRATYAVNASIDVDTGVLRVATTITARNDSGAGIDRLELNTIAARLGGIAVTSASVEDSPVSVAVSDQTISVPLGGVLPAGATVELALAYRATLKTSYSGSNWMFTRAGGTIALYRWIPWISLARPFDRPNIGDPFVTPTSPEVVVNLTLDKARVLAAPTAGIPTTASKTWTFEVNDVRDVSIVLAPDFTVNVRYVDGVKIRAYSRPGAVTGGKLADLAKLALDREAARLGVAYPWPSFTIVETGGGLGLESPGLVWIPGSTSSASLSYLIHHEIAHQWFYGLVGNDQQRQPFADEAAADLLARTVLGTLRDSRCVKDELDRRITQYTGACYYETIYIQGGNTLNRYRERMGTTLFWATIRDYLETYRHRIAGTKKLLDMLRDASPVDISPDLRARFPTLY